MMWFLQLSGWPALLAVIAVVAVFMIVASVALTKLGNRSVLQSMVIAASAVTILTLIVLLAFALLTRR